MAKKRVLIATGGGDCPGLNAVIRAIVKRAQQEKNWQVIGSIQSFDGVLKEPTEIKILDDQAVNGIAYMGGTILGTTTKGGPLAWPVKKSDGTYTFVDRSEEMIRKLSFMGVDAVINIGGDGSQKISNILYKKGLNIVGVPKTIDNDLSATDFTFGYQTAVEIATDAVDKLKTTAASHNRIFILEVMGRNTGWIALSAAVAGGADVCIIPEIPYDVKQIIEKIDDKYNIEGRGFAIIVLSEGAIPLGGEASYTESTELGNKNLVLTGAGRRLKRKMIKFGVEHDIRVTVLGHIQRGGIPCAYDRILAAQYGVKAFEMVLAKNYGSMVSYRHPNFISVPLIEAVNKQNFVNPANYLVNSARGSGISFGD